MKLRCANPHCGEEFAKDRQGDYPLELVDTGIDHAFVCPTCKHWNRLAKLDNRTGAESNGTDQPSAAQV